MILPLIILSATLILFHLVNGWLVMRRHVKPDLLAVQNRKGMSVLIPCYNEENTVKSSVLNILANIPYYPDAEYIFINDGSTDSTLQRLDEELELIRINKTFDYTIPHKPLLNVYQSNKYLNVYVLDKLNGGKADSLNAGVQ